MKNAQKNSLSQVHSSTIVQGTTQTRGNAVF